MKVAVDIGGSGALARIEKGRKIMKNSRTEWSSVDELPVSFSRLSSGYDLYDRVH